MLINLTKIPVHRNENKWTASHVNHHSMDALL